MAKVPKEVAKRFRRQAREPLLSISIGEPPMLRSGGFAIDHIVEPAVLDMPVFADLVFNKVGRALCQCVLRIQMRRLPTTNARESQEGDVDAAFIVGEGLDGTPAHIRFVFESREELRYDINGELCRGSALGEQIFKSPWLARYRV